MTGQGCTSRLKDSTDCPISTDWSVKDKIRSRGTFWSTVDQKLNKGLPV